MSDNEVAAVEAVSRKTSMQNYMDTSGYDAQQSALTDRAMEEAFSIALRTPGGLTAAPTSEAEKLSGPIGEVGVEKNEIATGDTSNITDGKKNADGTIDTGLKDSLEQRAIALYGEMTHYTVAWGLARRTQQDTSQLLRGS